MANPSDTTGPLSDALRERTRERMARLGIPRGTDDPLLLALGAAPFEDDDDDAE